MPYKHLLAAVLAGGGSSGSGSVQSIVSTAVVGVPMSFVGSGSPIQWNKNGTPIVGANSSTYTPVSGDAQSTLTVTVNGTTSAGVIVAPASAAYATALAAVADGQYFTAPNAGTTRLRVYQRLAGVGVLYDVTPASGSVNAAAALVRAAISMPVTPLVDFDSTDAYYGECEFQSRVPGDPVRTFNLLGHFSYSNGYATQGTTPVPVIIPRVADSLGGTMALQVQMASGSAALTDVFIATRIPPGTYTLAFDAKVTGQGTTQSIKYGYNGTTTQLTANLTTSWQTFTQTFNVTAEGAFNVLFVHGDYPSVASVAYDFAIANLRLVPGTSAAANADTAAHPSIYSSSEIGYTGLEINGATGQALNAKLATLTSLTAWTFMSTVNGSIGASFPAIGAIIKNAAPPTATYVAQSANTNNGQTTPITVVGAASLIGTQWGNAGRCTFAVTADSTTLSVYVNGVLIETLATNAGTQANMAALLLNGSGSGAQGVTFPLVGTKGADTFWTSALTGAQVAAAHIEHARRATAKSLPIASVKNVVLGEGDSRPTGSLDTGASSVAFVRRATQLVGGNRIQCEMRSVNGSTFAIMNARKAALLAKAAIYQAAGIQVITPILIGTNDDTGAQALTSQTAVDDYYLNYLLPYYASLRAAGIKVIACTEICNGRTAAYDGTSTGAITSTTANAYGSLAGNTYASWRYYLNALLMQHSADTTVYDAIADLANASGFSTYAASSAVMGDTVHPNSLGHANLATVLGPKITALLAP